MNSSSGGRHGQAAEREPADLPWKAARASVQDVNLGRLRQQHAVAA
ncbi:hypothetical protein ACIQVO_36050 [Streptomyces sp. NPDC101062]